MYKLHISEKRGDIILNSIYIKKKIKKKKKIKEYYEKLYAHKLDNPDEMDSFLERHNPLKLTQEEMDNLNI